MMKRLLLLCYTLLYIGALLAFEPDDSLEVGLMTCAPGDEVYELYGHTAIRVRDVTTGDDVVFNYGMFSFDAPHFVWRFTKGECDYYIAAMDYPHFAHAYAARGSAVIQQTLNLTAEEKWRLFALLCENLKPENRMYRYNFLYDNCTTRARDRIEEAVDGEVVYAGKDSVCSFRQIIHRYTEGHPWAELGNDICLGAETDRPITVRQEMFAPFYLLDYFDGAVIRGRNGNTRPLVCSKQTVVEGCRPAVATDRMPSPACCAWLLFALVAVLTVAEYRLRRSFWPLDAVLMTLTGIIGCVVAFLFFFSLHPTVGTNWQIWVFNPVPLLAMPWVVWCAVKRRKTGYHAVNAVVLMFFILFSALIPQDLCAVVVPLALSLWLRSCSYLINYRRNNL